MQQVCSSHLICDLEIVQRFVSNSFDILFQNCKYKSQTFQCGLRHLCPTVYTSEKRPLYKKIQAYNRISVFISCCACVPQLLKATVFEPCLKERVLIFISERCRYLPECDEARGRLQLKSKDLPRGYCVKSPAIHRFICHQQPNTMQSTRETRLTGLCIIQNRIELENKMQNCNLNMNVRKKTCNKFNSRSFFICIRLLMCNSKGALILFFYAM